MARTSTPAGHGRCGANLGARFAAKFRCRKELRRDSRARRLTKGTTPKDAPQAPCTKIENSTTTTCVADACHAQAPIRMWACTCTSQATVPDDSCKR